MWFAARFGDIQDGLGDGPFLMGERLTLADMQMCYTIEIARVMRLLAFPASGPYLDRLNERPGLRKAIEIGGPLSPDEWG